MIKKYLFIIALILLTFSSCNKPPKMNNSILERNMKLKLISKYLKNDLSKYNSFKIFIHNNEDTVYSYDIMGDKAIDDWKILRKITDETGFYPIILGESDQLDFSNPSLMKGDSLCTNSQLLRKGMSLNPKDLFKEWVEDDPEYYAIEKGEWAANPYVKNNIRIPYNLVNGKPLKVNILLIPTKKSYEVPSILKFGGWNYCPFPEEQISILKYWYDKYGAELVAIDNDTIEMIVKKLPTDREEAIKLAKEQIYYCPDRKQDFDTLLKLASSLMVSNYWYFWWD